MVTISLLGNLTPTAGPSAAGGGLLGLSAESER